MRQSAVIKSEEEIIKEHAAQIAKLDDEKRAKAEAEFQEERQKAAAATAERQALYDKEMI